MKRRKIHGMLALWLQIMLARCWRDVASAEVEDAFVIVATVVIIVHVEIVVVAVADVAVV